MRTNLVTTTAFLAVALISPGMAEAPLPPISLLGITIGEALPSMPGCGTAEDAALQMAKMCRLETTIFHSQTPPGVTNIELRYAATGVPPFVKYDRFAVLTMDGKVEQILIWTTGQRVQAAAVRQLSEKFGKPASLKEEKLHNNFGATFSSIVADWPIGNSHVQFRGIVGDVNTGSITADSAKYRGKIAQYYKAKEAAEPHL